MIFLTDTLQFAAAPLLHLPFFLYEAAAHIDVICLDWKAFELFVALGLVWTSDALKNKTKL